MYRSIDITKYDAQTIFGLSEIGNGCWNWRGSLYRNGYGKYGSRGYMAHRLAYELTKGSVPEDMCLDHTCRNRSCINPDHLEIVTLVENVMRGESLHALNARKTHCSEGHEFTDKNTYRRQDRETRECKTCRRNATNKHRKESRIRNWRRITHHLT
jgi:hypothetical protein